MRIKTTVSADDGSDEDHAHADKSDKRKFNRGASSRRSYTKEEKLSVIRMRDSGQSYEEIAKLTGFSRVNMEKWCSLKGREAILAKVNKVSELLAEASANRNAAKMNERSFVTVTHRIGEPPTAAHPVHHPVPQVVAKVYYDGPSAERAAVASIQASLARAVSNHSQGGLVAPQKKHQLREHLTATSSRSSRVAGNADSTTADKANNGKVNEVNEDSSDEDCGGGDGPYPRDDYRADHFLHLVAKEECLLKMGRRTTRSQSATASVANSKAAGSASATTAPKAIAPVPSTARVRTVSNAGSAEPPIVSLNSLVPFSTKPDRANPFAPVLADENLRRELERVIHSQVASNITMTISDAMLQPDFSAFAGASSGASFGMSTSLQATRPIVSNTKFFRAVNEDRKKRKQAAEEASASASAGAAGAGNGRSRKVSRQSTANSTKRARYLDEMDLSEEDSDQEKEDERILTLLGE